MHFSRAGSHLQAFASRKQGERYAFVNLLYFLTNIFLYREHTPLHMLRHSTQREISGLNSLREVYPTDWKKESADKLSENACSLVEMMKQLTSQGIDLRLPFTCYCVFSATTVLASVRRWPKSDTRRDDSIGYFNWGVQWVSKASEIWEVAKPWKASLDSLSSSCDKTDWEHHAATESLSHLTGHPPVRQLESDFNARHRPNFAMEDLASLDGLAGWGPWTDASYQPWLFPG